MSDKGSSVLYRTIMASSDGAFATNKGMSTRCPFCMTESSKGREKFLIFINDDGLYTGHHCFVCRDSGSGVFGLGRMLEMMGKKMSIIDLDDLCANGDKRPRSLAPSDVVTSLSEWPPLWAKSDPEITALAVSYLTGRGVMNPERLLLKYNCIASHVVMTSRGTTMDYPCVIWPMEDQDRAVVGWASRAIGEPRDGMPKSMGMTGAGWKEASVFGLSMIDSRLPVTVVEGFVSALATPNSVATCGKAVSSKQVELIAGLEAPFIILALDPDVKAKDVQKLETSFIMASPGSDIHVIDWAQIDLVPDEVYGPVNGDPADRGAAVMAKIIKKIIKGEGFDY